MIKKTRVKLGLSQADLAKGICSQGTISGIEKFDKVTRFNTLSQICERLHLELEDINHPKTKELKRLKQVENHLVHHNFAKAALSFEEIPVEKVNNSFQQIRYECILGHINLGYYHNLDEAAFHFTKVISRPLEDKVDFYIAWSNYGMATVWKRKQAPKKSLEFLEQAVSVLRTIKLAKKQDYSRNTDLIIEILSELYELQEFQRVIDLSAEVETFLLSQKYHYKLDFLKDFRARSLRALGKQKQGFSEHLRHGLMQKVPEIFL